MPRTLPNQQQDRFTEKKVPPVTRAQLCYIEPGNDELEDGLCAYCKEQGKKDTKSLITYRASTRTTVLQVIVNIYENGVWIGKKHYHHDCYKQAGRPHGREKKLKKRLLRGSC